MSKEQTPLEVVLEQESLPNMARDVIDFQHKYGIQYEGPQRMLPPQLKYFRRQRSQEEQREFFHAPDLAEALDAIVDEIYIILGTAHLMGFTPEVIAEAWRRVHEANMKKEKSTPENPGKYGAVGTDIVKPKGWVAPDLSDLVS